jgi:hypothetical protein
MALLPHQVDDFVNLTIDNFKRTKWTDLSLEHQEYCVAAIMTDRKIIERGGPQINFKVQTKNTGTARPTGLFSVDQTAVEDLTIEGTETWTATTANWSYDIYEDLFQTDKETIIRELVVREHACMNDLIELAEQQIWTEPTGSETDAPPKGIPYWIQKDATTTPGGAFNGGNPSGFAAGCANISSLTVPRWRNWTFGYTSITSDDLVAKTKKAITFTRFRAPNPHPELAFGKGDQSAIYTTYRVLEPLERLAETRNDNLGKDVARYMNQVVIGGVPIKWVPYLEANDSTDPLYGVQWSSLRPYFKRGANMRRTKKDAPRQRNVREVHYDSWYNYICTNRRLNWVGSTS